MEVLNDIIKTAKILSSDLDVSDIEAEINDIKRKYKRICNCKEDEIEELLKEIKLESNKDTIITAQNDIKIYLEDGDDEFDL